MPPTGPLRWRVVHGVNQAHSPNQRHQLLDPRRDAGSGGLGREARVALHLPDRGVVVEALHCQEPLEDVALGFLIPSLPSLVHDVREGEMEGTAVDVVARVEVFLPRHNVRPVTFGMKDPVQSLAVPQRAIVAPTLAALATQISHPIDDEFVQVLPQLCDPVSALDELVHRIDLEDDEQVLSPCRGRGRHHVFGAPPVTAAFGAAVPLQVEQDALRSLPLRWRPSFFRLPLAALHAQHHVVLVAQPWPASGTTLT